MGIIYSLIIVSVWGLLGYSAAHTPQERIWICEKGQCHETTQYVREK